MGRPYLGSALVVVGAALVATAPLAVGSDGAVRLRTLDQLLRTGHADASKYSLVGPLCAAPLWSLGEAVGRTDETVWVFNRVVFLLFLAGLWLVLRPALDGRERLRVVLLLLFASMIPWHVQGFFGEVFHVACVGLGVALAVLRGGRWGWVGWPLAVVGTVNVPPTGVGLALAAVVIGWHRRRLRYGLAVAAAAGLILLDNHLRRGDPFASGYETDHGFPNPLPFAGRPGFSYPLFFGLLSVLFSFGKGLVFFTPGLFLRYPREATSADAEVRLLYRAWVAVVVGLVLVYARWWAWYGGVAWGPRFFLFACLPAALVLARWTARPAGRTLRANLLVLAAVALSGWGAAAGLVFGEHGTERYWSHGDYTFEPLVWYVPECSVLWLPFVAPKPLDAVDRARLLGCAAGVAYLAWPVVAAVAPQLWGRVAAAWRALRVGPRFRF